MRHSWSTRGDWTIADLGVLSTYAQLMQEKYNVNQKNMLGGLHKKESHLVSIRSDQVRSRKYHDRHCYSGMTT